MSDANVPHAQRLGRVERRPLSFIAGTVVVTFGSAVLAGWAFGLEDLKTLFPGAVTMKVNTALSLVFLGAALIALAPPTISRGRRWLGCLLAGTVISVGLVTLLEYVIGRDLGVDQFLFPDSGTLLFGGSPGRMSVLTATTLILVGVAVITLITPVTARRRHVQWFLIPALLISYASLIAYTFGANRLLLLTPGTTPMALHTSLALIIASIGILFARPDRGLIRFAGKESSANALVRVMLPAFIIGFPILGWLRIVGFEQGWYGERAAIALFAVTGVALAVGLVWIAARLNDRTDKARRVAEGRTKDSERLLQSFLDNMTSVAVLKDPDGKILLANAAFEDLIGQRLDAMIGKRDVDVLPPHAAAIAQRLRESATGTRQPVSDEIVVSLPTGQHTLLVQVFPIPGNDGTTVAVGDLLTDITDLKRTEIELERSRADLERSNHDLERFAYIASHDLQEPLRTVGGFAQLIQRRYRGTLDPAADEFIDYMVQGTKRMQAMINDLLAYSRVGRGDLVMEPTALDDLAASVRRDIGASMEESGGTLTISPLPVVHGNATQLQMVLQNLVANAIKYRGASPPVVDVWATLDGDRWTIHVRDNGIGIPPDEADHIFEVFYRLHRQDEYAGTGIGLSVCRRIIEQHGGQICVETNGTNGNGGSTFSFTLSAVAPATAVRAMEGV